MFVVAFVPTSKYKSRIHEAVHRRKRSNTTDTVLDGATSLKTYDGHARQGFKFQVNFAWPRFSRCNNTRPLTDMHLNMHLGTGYPTDSCQHKGYQLEL